MTSLYLSIYTPGEPNSGWIHCSYTEGMPRASIFDMRLEKTVKQNTNL